MKSLIQSILQRERQEEVLEYSTIHFGSVNEVFEVHGSRQRYILRLNDEEAKRLEFEKEAWCIEEVAELGIPSPTVLARGEENGYHYLLENKLTGINGSLCSKEEKDDIWKALGHYSFIYRHISHFDLPELNEREFHKNWQSKLTYNLGELHPKDSLLSRAVLTQEEHEHIRSLLQELQERHFNVGLVHGDLSPRNTIVDGNEIHLIDWGTAEINIVPHTEIGIVLNEGEASETEFQAFLLGMGLSSGAYQAMEKDIRLLNLLHRLDKYRWAEGYQADSLSIFDQKLKDTYQTICYANW